MEKPAYVFAILGNCIQPSETDAAVNKCQLYLKLTDSSPVEEQRIS